MRTLIIYDSYFGCTKQVAEQLFEIISGYHQTDIMHVKNIQIDQIYDYEMIFIGSPTRGFTATKETKQLIKRIRNLKEFKIGVFDTRVPEVAAPKFLRFLMRKFGYANDTMAKMVYHSDSLLLDPQLFIYVEQEKNPENYKIIPGQEKAMQDWILRFVSPKSSPATSIPEVDIRPETPRLHIHELDQLSVVELKKLASEMGIKNYSKMKKQELIEHLKH